MEKKEVKLNDKNYIISFLDKENNPCEEKNAYMVSISEYDKDNNFIRNTVGYVNAEKQD